MKAKYLRVTLSDDLQRSKHISNLSVKAGSTLGLLRRNLSQCPQALREQVYISLIRSRLEYCSTTWDPHLVKDIDSLENIQRWAARFTVQDYSRYTSVSTLLQGLDWSPLKERRRDIRLTFLFKIIKGKVAVQAEGSLVTADSWNQEEALPQIQTLTCVYWTMQKLFFNSLPDSCQGGYCRPPPSRSSCTAPHSCCAKAPPPPPPPPTHTHTHTHTHIDVIHSVACWLNI